MKVTWRLYKEQVPHITQIVGHQAAEDARNAPLPPSALQSGGAGEGKLAEGAEAQMMSGTSGREYELFSQCRMMVARQELLIAHTYFSSPSPFRAICSPAPPTHRRPARPITQQQASFPLDRYLPLLPNTAPITELTVHICSAFSQSGASNPAQSAKGGCYPPSTPLDDATLGPWVRVERELDSVQARARGAQNAAEPPGSWGAPSAQSPGSGQGLINGLTGALPGWLGGGGALSGLNEMLEHRAIYYRRSRVPWSGSSSNASKSSTGGGGGQPAVVVDVRVVEQGETPPDGAEGWWRVKTDVRSRWLRMMGKTKAAHIYFRTAGGGEGMRPSSVNTERSLVRRRDGEGAEARRERAERTEPITEVDIIVSPSGRESCSHQRFLSGGLTSNIRIHARQYGPNAPLPGFELAGEIVPDSQSAQTPGARLAIRRMPAPLPEIATPLTFRTDGTFKILQLADLHYSVEPEPCRDVPKAGVEWKHTTSSNCDGYNETLPVIEKWLDAEKPDLVVLTGDQFNGQRTSWDERSVVMKVVEPLIRRKILWAAILGNHDSQSGRMKRRELQSMLRQLPYSVTYAGPQDVHLASNFYLQLHSPTPDRTMLANLYFLDSGAWVPKESGLFGWGAKEKDKGVSEYDYVHADQVAWFDERVRKHSKKLVRPYTPDGVKDLDRVWDRGRQAQSNDSKSTSSSQQLRKPTGIAFVHIPVPEAFNGTVDTDPATGKELIIGERMERKTSLVGGQSRAGLFGAIQRQGQDGERDVEVLVHGHMHNNYDCRRTQGVWICFGGGSSFAGYGDRELKRRTRVLEMRKWGEEIVTWHRYDDNNKGEASTLFKI